MVRKVVVGLGFVLAFSVAVAALSHMADGLPKPIGDAALLPGRLWTRLFPPRVSRKVRLADLTRTERKVVDRFSKRLDGMLVWSSNRSGNHELYRLDVRERSVRRLTNNPAADFFPRFSPDGKQIVFVRSQRPGVSFRDQTSWDVYLIGVDGKAERRIARSGYHPTWTADGKGIVFHRQTSVFRYDLGSGRETLVLDVGQELPGIEDFGDVELSPDGRRWAFPLRGRFQGAFGLSGSVSGAVLFDPEARTLAFLSREQACETTWAPDGRSLLWIETGGNGGTRVMVSSADGSDRRVFMDLPGAYSHEYFPKLSNDGRWLVWGAAAEGHEHDRAGYEIFVWEIDTPVDQAVRLTHHPANDNWPDLWVRPAR